MFPYSDHVCRHHRVVLRMEVNLEVIPKPLAAG